MTSRCSAGSFASAIAMSRARSECSASRCGSAARVGASARVLLSSARCGRCALERLFVATPARALAIERAAARDRRQPRRYGAARSIVFARFAPRLPERLLHCILRLVGLPEQIVRERVDGRCPPVVERAERLLVAASHARHEGRIGVSGWGHEHYGGIRSQIARWIHRAINVESRGDGARAECRRVCAR